MHRIILSALLGVSILLAGQASAFVTVIQDGSGDYTGIQAALDDSSRTSDEIVVYPGIYRENILIGGSITLRAYEGPYLTTVDGSLHTDGRQDTITVNTGVTGVKIQGFCVSGGYYGIHVQTSSQVLAANCVVTANDSHGIYAQWTNGTNVTYLDLYNNVCMQNGGSGIYFLWSNTYYCFYVNAKNNICTLNTRYGIEMATDPDTYLTRVMINFNDYSQNVLGPYGSHIGPAQSIVPGANETFNNPQFIGQTSGSGVDVRLQAASLCRKAGVDSAAFNNPDGTRNDQGAYGGPYAETFYESPSDGPIVKNLSIVEGSVPQGDTFTITATVAVR